MSAIANFPEVRPTLLLDFANSGRIDPRMQSTRASAATCFSSTGKLRVVAANVPRIDYDPVTGKCLGLLVEAARTNLSLSLTSWVLQGGALTASAVMSPMPGVSYQVFTPDTGGLGKGLREDTLGLLAGFEYTRSVYVKSSGYRFLRMEFATAGGAFDRVLHVVFDVISGQVVSSAAGVTGHIQPLSDGCFRCSITATAVADGRCRTWCYLSQDGVAINQPGNGVDGMLFFGPQLEEGGSPTSYIPTTTTQATRALESISLDRSLVGTLLRDDFTLVQEVTSSAPIPIAAGTLRHLGMSVNASGNNRLRIYANAANGGRIAMSGRLNNATETFAATLQANLGTSIPRMCAALAVSSTEVVRGCMNGGAVSSGAQAGAITGAPMLYFGTLAGQTSSTDLPTNGHIQRVAIYPGALSNSHLQGLTRT